MTRGIAFSSPRLESRGCCQPPFTRFAFSRVFAYAGAAFVFGGATVFFAAAPTSGSPHRTHKSRIRSTPAAANDIGSNESETSTNAHVSCRAVACASNEKLTLVRPEEEVPQSSITDPLGNPPRSNASNSVMPVGCSSAGMRCRKPSNPRPKLETSCSRVGAREFMFAFCSPSKRIDLRPSPVNRSCGTSAISEEFQV